MSGIMYQYICNCLVGCNVGSYVVRWHGNSSSMVVHDLMNL